MFTFLILASLFFRRQVRERLYDKFEFDRYEITEPSEIYNKSYVV